MTTVAVLGLGLLGRGFAENLLAKGNIVRVWNRTASKAAPLAEKGAVVCETPADAARGASRVHLVLAEDAAVEATIEALRPGLAKDAYVVDHTTNLPAGVAERFPRLRAAGVRYVHAPVFMGPSNSRDGTGLMLMSGPAEDEAALRPLLETMTGKLLHLGAEPDKGAKIKLTGNGMLIMLAAVMGDLFRMGAASGVTPDEILALFDVFSPTGALTGRRILGAGSGKAPVSFELTMARKDVRLMLETAKDAKLTVLPSVAETMDEAIAAGHGAEDFTVIGTP